MTEHTVKLVSNHDGCGYVVSIMHNRRTLNDIRHYNNNNRELNIFIRMYVIQTPMKIIIKDFENDYNNLG